MAVKKFSRINQKVLTIVIPTIIVSTTLAVSIVLWRTRSALFSQVERRVYSLTKNFASSAVFAVATGDTTYLNKIKDRFFEDKDVVAIIVFDPDGKDIFTSFREDRYKGRIRSYYSSIYGRSGGVYLQDGFIYGVEKLKLQAGESTEFELGVNLGGKELGKVAVVFTTRQIRRDFLAVFTFALGVVMIILLTGGGTLGYVISRMFRPVKEIVATSRLVSKGDLTATLQVSTRDEIEIFAESFNKMVENLKDTIERITNLSVSVSEAVGRARKAFQTVVESSKRQKDYITEMEDSIEKVNSAARNIAENTEILKSSAEDGSSSILEMNASIEEAVENMERLAESVDETTVSIQEMAASIKQVAGSVQNLLQALQSTVQAVDSINENISQIEKNADQMAKSSEKVKRSAEEGENALKKTTRQMNRIKETVSGVESAIEVLNHRLGEIGKIVNVIDDIAEQTNLLALNAAIIAAQSGERGRGFSVVADNIKELSDRTSQSTKEINALIEGVMGEMSNVISAVSQGIEAVEEGVQIVSETSHLLTQITTSAEDSFERSLNIAKATKEQAKASSEVASSTKVISDMASEIQRAINEQAKGSDMIKGAAERMKDISDFVKNSMNELLQSGKRIGQIIENVTEMVKFIADATHQQSERTQEVTRKMEETASISDQNVEMVEGVRKSFDELMRQIAEMSEVTKTFKIRRRS